MDKKTKILNTWEEHKKRFQYHSFEHDGQTGFIAINFMQNPAKWMMLLTKNNEIRGYRGYSNNLNENNIDNIDTILNDKDKINLPPDEALCLFGLSGNIKNSLAEESIDAFENTLNDPRLSAILPRKELVFGEIKRMNENGLDIFKKKIDQDALNALSTQDSFLWKDYDFFSKNNDNFIYRKQAADAYPMFTKIMSSRMSVRLAIDTQKSLQDALQIVFGENKEKKPNLSKGLLKRFHGLRYPLNGLTIEKIIDTLSQLPPDWFPKDENEWDAFCDITATVGSILPKVTGNNMETLFQGCQGKWQVYKERLINEITDIRPPEGLTEDAIKILDEYMDLKRFKKISKDKIKASAIVLTEGLTSLPEGINVNDYEQYEPGQILPYGINRDHIIDWIERMYAPVANRTVLNAACINVDDMVTIFNNKVVIPLAMNRTGEKISYINQIIKEEGYLVSSKILFDKMSATAILSQSRHFMTRVTEILAAGSDSISDEEKIRREEAKRTSSLKTILGLPDEESKDAWAPLIQITKTPNGLYIVPLNESYLLKDEGRGWGRSGDVNKDGTKGLSMCVGEMGYDKKCRNSGHHILSVREITPDGKSFKRLGCAEISRVKKDNTFTVNQFRGKSNGQPIEKAISAFDWFKRSVASGQIPLNHDGIMKYHASVKKTDEVMDLCDYNWRDKNLIMKAMYPWGKYVGKAFRSMNVEKFADTDEIMKIALEINPNTKKEKNNLNNDIENYTIKM